MSPLLDLARAGKPLTALDITDMHGHLGRFNFTIPDLSTAGMVAAMDRLGVARIVCSHMRCMSADAAWGNDEVLRAMGEQPGRILGYFSVWPSDAAAVRREAELRVGQGFVGFKVHNVNGFAYDDPAYEPAYELSQERGLPVLAHTWGDPGEFKTIRILAGRYPRLAFLLAHAGAANEAGYIAIARECPNVYLDTAYSACPRGSIERLVKGAGAEKVVWGSDCYFFSIAQQIGKVLGSAISDADKIRLLSGNARRLLPAI